MLRPRVLATLMGLCLLASACAQDDADQATTPSAAPVEGPNEVLVFGSVESIIQFRDHIGIESIVDIGSVKRDPGDLIFFFEKDCLILFVIHLTS